MLIWCLKSIGVVMMVNLNQLKIQQNPTLQTLIPDLLMT